MCVCVDAALASPACWCQPLSGRLATTWQQSASQSWPVIKADSAHGMSIDLVNVLKTDSSKETRLALNVPSSS
jgi:hypothetical protein